MFQSITFQNMYLMTRDNNLISPKTAKYLNIYLVRNGKIFNENTKNFLKIFQLSNEKWQNFCKNTKTFKSIISRHIQKYSVKLK